MPSPVRNIFLQCTQGNSIGMFYSYISSLHAPLRASAFEGHDLTPSRAYQIDVGPFNGQNCRPVARKENWSTRRFVERRRILGSSADTRTSRPRHARIASSRDEMPCLYVPPCLYVQHCKDGNDAFRFTDKQRRPESRRGFLASHRASNPNFHHQSRRLPQRSSERQHEPSTSVGGVPLSP